MSDEATGKDRITEVRIQGMRALADVRLPLGGLTVLIGENGSGKSTIIEALELLRRIAQPGHLDNDLLGPFHGGLDALLRAGERTLRLGVRIDGAGGRIEYTVALTKQRISTLISEERLDLWTDPGAAEPRRILVRDSGTCQLLDVNQDKLIKVEAKPAKLSLHEMRNLEVHTSQAVALVATRVDRRALRWQGARPFRCPRRLDRRASPLPFASRHASPSSTSSTDSAGTSRTAITGSRTAPRTKYGSAPWSACARASASTSSTSALPPSAPR